MLTELLFTLITLLLAMGIVLAIITTKLMKKLHPGELAVIVGLQENDPKSIALDGYKVYTKPVIAGRAPNFVPLNKLYKMDVRPLELDFTVDQVSTDDDRQFAITAEATVHFDTEPDNLNRPIEMFLGRPHQEVASVATKVIASNVRGAVARLTADELETDLSAISENALQSAEFDLAKLGLIPQSLSILRASRV